MGSYNSEAAEEWGQSARDLMAEVGPEYFHLDIDPQRKARNNWGMIDTRTNKPTQGTMRTMGMDAGITGKPANGFIIDDAFRGWEEASSPSHQAKVWKIYTSCVDTRLQPGGFIAQVYTPWNKNDLGGMCMARQPGEYKILRMPALAEIPISDEERAKKTGYTALVGAPDPLDRKPGQALWPSRFDEAHYARKKKLDPEVYDALYACNPHPLEGGFFQRSWFKSKILTTIPRCKQYVRYWDKAASAKGNWSAGVLMGVLDGDVYIIDVQRQRLEPGPRDAWIRETAAMDEAVYGHVMTWGEHAGNEHKETAANFIKNLIGYPADTEGTGNKSKSTRAYPFAKYCQAGNVFLKLADWNDIFIDELCDFKPEINAQQDDQVDAASGAFGKIALKSIPPNARAGIQRVEYDPLSELRREMEGSVVW